MSLARGLLLPLFLLLYNYILSSPTMTDLKALGEKVHIAITERDGSWQSQKALLDSIEELRIAAMGPAEYTTRLRYQVNICLH